MVQELYQTLSSARVSLESQRALKTDSDEKLQVVCETGDEGEKFLSDAKPPNASVLRACQQLKE